MSRTKTVEINLTIFFKRSYIDLNDPRGPMKVYMMSKSDRLSLSLLDRMDIASSNLPQILVVIVICRFLHNFQNINFATVCVERKVFVRSPHCCFVTIA
jgi:hypothetical protein